MKVNNHLLEAVTSVNDEWHKCPLCGYTSKKINSLWEHFDVVHADIIPKDSSARRVIFNLRNRKPVDYSGSCVVCKRSVGFNEITGKYFRYCSEACIKAARNNFKKNMVKKYNKETLLDDPKHQLKMMRNRKISGVYTFTDGGQLPYVGSYEKDFLEFLDHILNMPSEEVLADFVTFNYEFEGETLTYIPDYYLQSLNLIVEIKDGGANPNNHHKIQAVDKKKELAKEEAIRKNGQYNYIKLTDKHYTEFILYLAKLKNSNGPLVQIMEGNMPTLEHLVNTKGKDYTGNLYVVLPKDSDGTYTEMYVTDSIEFDYLVGLNSDRKFVSKDNSALEETLVDVYIIDNGTPSPCGTLINRIIRNKNTSILEGMGFSSFEEMTASPGVSLYVSDHKGVSNLRYSKIMTELIEENVKNMLSSELISAVTTRWTGGKMVFMVTEAGNGSDKVIYQTMKTVDTSTVTNLPSDIRKRHVLDITAKFK